MLPFLSAAATQGRFKLYPAIEDAARALAHRRSVSLEEIFLRHPWTQADALSFFEGLGGDGGEGDCESVLTPAQRSASHLWFENLNTPEEFAEAEQHLDALDG
jgi:molybdopterin-guanine dinucleotide biosynthesis protein A